MASFSQRSVSSPARYSHFRLNPIPCDRFQAAGWSISATSQATIDATGSSLANRVTDALHIVNISIQLFLASSPWIALGCRKQITNLTRFPSDFRASNASTLSDIIN